MKNNYTVIRIHDQEIYLLPQKAVFFPVSKKLLISDLHLGKTTHFRKHGLAIPTEAQFEDLLLLTKIIAAWQPTSILILGDLFHSDFNSEWFGFEKFLLEHESIQFILVKGNHDIINFDKNIVPNFSITMLLEDEHFSYRHHPIENKKLLNFCGHIHPAIVVKLKGKQHHTLTCFLVEENNFILPAFGSLTGNFIIEKKKKNVVYAIVGNKVLEVK